MKKEERKEERKDKDEKKDRDKEDKKDERRDSRGGITCDCGGGFRWVIVMVIGRDDY